MTWPAVIGFFLAVLPIVMTPGASFTLATQRTMDREPHGAAWVIAGTATGIYCHALLAAAGLSMIVMRSSEAFTAVKIAGGICLVGLGLYTLWKSCRRAERPATVARRLPWAGHHSYPQAVLVNVLNPKAASVYLTLAPQFMSADHVGVAALLLLATAHVLAMAMWLAVWSAVVSKGRKVTDSPRFKTTVNRIGSTVLIALGFRTMAAH
jgi:threonine/homoserine/homoserine lactone efflux protein